MTEILARCTPAGQPGGNLAICLILPRFEPSFFGNDYALPILPGGKSSTMIGCALPLLAALTPPEHAVTIIDENVEPLVFEALGRFDVVGVTGMVVQRARMIEILHAARGSGAILCVGGPFVSVDPAPFEDCADVLFLGEADETWPMFLREIAEGRTPSKRYKQAASTDMARLPPPRYDLARTGRYQSAALQFSRGCPYLCEFCDIIVLFGRKPRLKSVAQVLAELDALLQLGMSHVFFVDDNFIGNRAQARILLGALAAWQASRGYPMHFSTEATVNLGDAPDILDLMWRAGFRSVFIGIESPRRGSLLETRKVQNVAGDPLGAKLERVRDAGLIVQAGFIVGFDADDERVFDEQFDFIQENGIGITIVSMLSPIPSTPLYERLAREGRLVPSDELLWFEPKGMSRPALKAGYARLVRRLYEPAAFFDRVMAGYRASALFRERLKAADARRVVGPAPGRVASGLAFSATAVRLARAMAADGVLLKMARAYLAAYLRQRAALRSEAWRPGDFLVLCVRHWHFHRVANDRRSYWGKAGTHVGAAESENRAQAA